MNLNLRRLGLAPSQLVRFVGRHTLLWLALGIAGSLFLAAAELAVASFLQLFLKSLGILSVELGKIGNLFTDDVGPVAITTTLCIIALARSAGQFLVYESGVNTSEGINKRLRLTAMYDILLNQNRKSISSAEVNYHIGEVFPKSAQFFYYVSQLIAQLIQALALSLMMFWSAWRETVVTLVCLGAVGLVVTLINRRVRNIASKIPTEHAQLTRGIERVARNWLLVRILKTQEHEHSHCAERIRGYARYAVGAHTYANVATSGTPFLGILVLVLVIWLSQNIFRTSGLALLSFLYLFVRFVQLLSNTASSLGMTGYLWTHFKIANQYFSKFSNSELEIALSPDLKRKNLESKVGLDSKTTESSPPSISIKDLSFSYDKSATEIIHNVNVEVRSGEQLGIIGPSGCGKSTLLGLVLGLLKPTSGVIKVNGAEPERFLDAPVARIGYVGAEPFLLEGTIEENLTYGLRKVICSNDLDRALEMARLLEFVKTRTGGLQYRISQNGDELSAGQKQRLCLARALLNEPQLLILDEASANLDLKTEFEIAEALKQIKGKCTVLVVSHREGILRNSDSVLNLENTGSSNSNSENTD